MEINVDLVIPGGQRDGVADSRALSMAAFKESWDRRQQRRVAGGLEASFRAQLEIPFYGNAQKAELFESDQLHHAVAHKLENFLLMWKSNAGGVGRTRTSNQTVMRHRGHPRRTAVPCRDWMLTWPGGCGVVIGSIKYTS